MNTVRFSEVVNSSGRPDTHLLLMAPAKDKELQAAIKANRVMTVYQGLGSTKTDYGTIGFAEGSSRQFLLFPKTLKSFEGKRVIGIKYDLLESIPVSKEEATSKPKSGKAPTPRRDQGPTRVDHRPTNRKDDKAEKPTDDQPNTTPKSLADVLSDEAVTVIDPATNSSAESEALAKLAGRNKSKKKPPARTPPLDTEPVPGAPPEKVVEFPKPHSNEQRPDRSDEVEGLKRQVREAMDVLEQGKQVAAYNLLKRIVED